jgi:hypothetical protein
LQNSDGAPALLRLGAYRCDDRSVVLRIPVGEVDAGDVHALINQMADEGGLA